MHIQHIENMKKMSNEQRYDYFVRKVADFETVWLNSDISQQQNLREHIIYLWSEQALAQHYIENNAQANLQDEVQTAVHAQTASSTQGKSHIYSETLDEFFKWCEQNHHSAINFVVNACTDGLRVPQQQLYTDLKLEAEQYQ